MNRKNLIMNRILTILRVSALVAGIAIASMTVAANAQMQLWQTQQTTASTFTLSESSVFSSPFSQNQEVADDFQVTGSI